MLVPLQARSKGKVIQIVHDGVLEEAPSPFPPYILAPAGETLDETSTFEDYKLFDGKGVRLYRFSFGDLSTFEERRNQLRDRRTYSQQHLEEIFVDLPEFFNSHPQQKPLKVLTFDIEVLSDGSGFFPRAHSSPVIAIGAKIDDNPVIIFDGISKKRSSDKDIIEAFFAFIKQEDPDVIVTYNGWSFDIQYVLERCKIHHIPPDAFGRWVDENDMFFGRINWDVYQNDVAKDQTPALLNLKNRKLETIIEYLTKRKSPEIDASNTQSYLVERDGKLWLDERIKVYLEADVNNTKVVFDSYKDNSIQLAEFLQVPLASVIRVPNSFIPRIYYTRGLKGMGFIAVDSNADRYPDFKGKFEAAIVAINNRCSACKEVLWHSYCINCGKLVPEKQQLKPGFFPQVHKVDFAAYYASTLITFNLSPETTHFVRTYSYDDTIYPLKVERTTTGLLLHIPDKNYQQTIVISVDMSREGFLKKELLRLRYAREKVKDEMKQLQRGTPEYKVLDSKQNVYKLLGNKCYGYNGLKHATFGSMPVALAIVAICRWMTLHVDEWLKNTIIEIDTDGFILRSWEDDLEKTVTARLNKLIEETFGITESYILLEHDALRQAFFYKKKSYALMTDKGDLVKHGVALKSSRHPGVYDRAVNRIIDIILNQREVDWFTVVNELKDFKDLTLKDFVMRAKMTKDEEDYENDQAISLRLARQAALATKRKAEPGDQMEYVVTKGKTYTLRSLVKSSKEIDQAYYAEEVNKVLEIFDISTNPAQLELF